MSTQLLNDEFRSKSNLRSIILIVSALCIFFAAFLISPRSWSYASLSESGELTPAGKYLVGVEPQIFLNEGSGVNIGVFGDTRVTDSSSVRVHLGGGKIDFASGITYKVMPFPDIDRQPAMGFRIGGFYARKSGSNMLSVQFAPLASKRFEIENGILFPYIGVPITYTSMKDENKTGTQVVFGSEFAESDNSEFRYGTEIGISLKDSYSYILGTFSFTFDQIRRK